MLPFCNFHLRLPDFGSTPIRDPSNNEITKISQSSFSRFRNWWFEFCYTKIITNRKVKIKLIKVVKYQFENKKRKE